MESEVILEQNLYNSLTNLILYQNHVLIRKIAQDYPQWNLRNLKKYTKDKPEKTKLPKSKPKVKKIIKKEAKVESDCESDSEVKIIKKKVVLKRRKGKKDNDGYNLVEYLGNEYYIDNKTNYVYQSISKKDESEDEEDLEVEFVGMLEGKKINFDAESSS